MNLQELLNEELVQAIRWAFVDKYETNIGREVSHQPNIRLRWGLIDTVRMPVLNAIAASHGMGREVTNHIHE